MAKESITTQINRLSLMTLPSSGRGQVDLREETKDMFCLPEKAQLTQLNNSCN